MIIFALLVTYHVIYIYQMQVTPTILHAINLNPSCCWVFSQVIILPDRGPSFFVNHPVGPLSITIRWLYRNLGLWEMYSFKCADFLKYFFQELLGNYKLGCSLITNELFAMSKHYSRAPNAIMSYSMRVWNFFII